MSTTPWKPKKLSLKKKIEIDEIEFYPYPGPREKKSPWFRRCQSDISNWYINGKVFTSTTALKPNKLNFLSKKFKINKIEFCPYSEKRNRPGFVDMIKMISVLHL